MIVKMHQAKTQPVVRLTPITPVKPQRQFGRYKGMFEVPDSAFDPLTEEELAVWEDGPVFTDGEGGV
jgi:antitoxin (DNA-binding transcriptional repressor) of toxin-antitoxin stability system